MTERYIQSVFFWPADMKTPFRAVYGRIKGSTKYSKDFHQIAAPAARAMEKALGVPFRGQTPITWVWPGNTRASNSQFKPGAENDARSRAHWPLSESPDPWRLLPNPTEQTVEVIAGTPGARGEEMPNSQEEVAEKQLLKVQEDGERPWFIAVHLFGDGPVLHVRTVLENPKTGREYASWENLPERVRNEMVRVRKSGDATGYVEFVEGMPMTAGHLASKIMAAFKDSPNVLLVGPPGTGKTVALGELLSLYSGSAGESATFDPDKLYGAFNSTPAGIDGHPAARSVVFHPSYTYENFVMGLLPDVADGAVTVTPHVGPLLELAQFASEATENKALLILDEFNRGNAAAIFGDMLGLIDGDKRDVASIDTPYAHLGPKTGLGPLGRTITLPEDLRIIAAMNSADRSVAPLDAALRRRFSIIHVDPDIDLLRNHLNASVDEDFQVNDPDTWTTAGHVAAVAVELLESLNRRIMFVLGRDFLLGQSVFWNLAVTADVDAALESLAAALDNQVLGTLALSFTDDDEGLAAVLGVTEAKNAPAAAYWKAPPTDLMRWPNRLELRRFQEFELSELKQAIVRLLEPVPEFEDDPTGADVTTTADSPEPPEEM